MNLPQSGCCCCNNGCSSSLTNVTDYSADLNVNGSQEREKTYALHPSRRKRLSPKSIFMKTTQRHCVVVFILSAILLSFVGVGNSTEIPLNSNSYLNNNGDSYTPSPLGFPDVPSMPTGASSSLNNVVVPGPPSSSPTSHSTHMPSPITQSYYINGYANQIQKMNISDLRALAGNQPFQLWFRTVCSFGNVVYSNKFALRLDPQGYLNYLNLPSEIQEMKSKNVVADDHWHSVTFSGNQVFLDDPTLSEPIEWDNNTDLEANSKLNFFDGFVGCIRLDVPDNSSSSATSDASQTPSSNLQDEHFALYKLFDHKELQKYQPCNDLQYDLEFQCFQPDSFVLCSKCENNAKCHFTDGNNECVCESDSDSVRYYSPFCSTIPNNPLSTLSDVAPETRELHVDSGESSEPAQASTSSRTSLFAQSSSFMSSTTEHFAAPSSIEQNRLPAEGAECPCLHGGMCIATPENSTKICNCTDTGYRGRTCNNDVCDENPGVCKNGKCFDDPSKETGYECYCKPGFSGADCSHNFNECLSSPCRNNGTCNDRINDYECTCVAGYNGKNCETEINECEPNPCEHGSACNDLLADYNCTCTDGYAGKNCETDINECEAIPCLNNGTCVDKIAAFECICGGTGFDGEFCEHNIDDCEINPCKNEGRCEDGINNYSCECHKGYEGKNCSTDIKECESNPCKNGNCYEKSHPENYGTPSISELSDKHFDFSTAEGYLCVCDAGFNGDNCENNIDECERENPCWGHGKCTDWINYYNCTCDKGFTGEYCETDIDECVPNPCEQAKECRDLPGDYFCECNDGYGGKNCTVPLTACIKNVCFNEGTCKPNYDEATNVHSFTCSCKRGFTGSTCETRTIMGFNGSSIVEIVKNDNAYSNNKYSLSFEFRTTLPDVVLAVGQGTTFFFLGVIGGKLNLRSSLINSLQGMSAGTKLSNGNWHKVVVSINSSHVILSAVNEQVTLPIAESEDLPPQTTGFNLTYLGSNRPLGFLSQHDENPFVGCLQDVKINDDRILPVDGQENVNLTNIVPSCIRKEQCIPSPCQNKGTCTDLWQTYTCDCPRPHLGGKCEYSYIAATFNHEDSPNSLVTVDIPPERFAGVFNISMFVRTRDPRGTIFLLGDKEAGLNGSYIEASVTKSGNLAVQAKWTGQTDTSDDAKSELYSVDGLIADGNTHTLSVLRDRSFVVIHLDYSEHFRKSHTNKDFNPNIMYIGGKPASWSGQDTSTTTAAQEGHSGETSTSLPESPIDNNTEGTATETDGTSDVFVPEQFRFKGTIQDVRLNLSTGPSESGPSVGPRAKPQNVYIVEFFNLSQAYQMRHPLGRVTSQKLLEGTVSDNHCRSNPCLNGGVCKTTFNDFACDCAPQYDGKQCGVRLRCGDVHCPVKSKCNNINATGFECVIDAAFDGKGFDATHYVLRTTSPTDLMNSPFSELSFKYRTKYPGNVIHISNGTSFLRVSLDKNHDEEDSITFHFKNNQKVFIKDTSIFDGEWHTANIKFSHNENTLVLLYDKQNKSQSNFAYQHMYLKEMLLSPSVNIVVGSSLYVDEFDRTTSDDLEQSNKSYRGCLKDIYIGSYRLPFVSPSKLETLNEDIKNRSYIEFTAPTAFYINEELHSPEGHLPRLGCVLCYDKDCMNGGECFNSAQTYDCKCAEGFEGATCLTNIDECVSNNCIHGSCVDAINNYTCSCNRGYDGWHCDNDIDECGENGDEKCSNNGECLNEIGEYRCQCNEDYTGLHCDKRKKSTCTDLPCENEATCKEVGPQSNGVFFMCECGQGWEGEFCSERIDYCKHEECVNDGNCTNSLHGYRCNCLRGFDGLHCEINIDECTSNPCKNNGKCVDGVDSFTCVCDDTGFTGPVCENDVDECAELLSPCKHPLECENYIGGYICTCPDKLMCGAQCNIKNPCFGLEENVTCQNEGTCKAHCDENEEEDAPQPPKAECACLPEFTGALCESAIPLLRPAGEGSIDILLIIIPVLAAILIAATVGIIILVRMARRKRATRGVYSPSQQEYCNPRVELDNVMKPPPEERLI